MGLGDEVLAQLASLGYEEPTPIQQQAIPTTLVGRDLIGQAQTGTGKQQRSRCLSSNSFGTRAGHRLPSLWSWHHA